MKKFLIMALGLLMSLPVCAESLSAMMLPNPPRKAPLGFMQALQERKSCRDFSERPLSDVDLAGILWAADGINRKEEKKRTAPSAMNRQEIDLYVLLPHAAYKYEAEMNALNPVAEGDFRPLAAGKQEFVNKAPVVVVIAADMDRFGSNDEQSRMMAAVDAGIVSQNINLFCAANGLGTVTRASMDSEALSKALGLNPGQILILNNPVGVPVDEDDNDLE